MSMGGMLENSKELDRVRKEQEDVFLEINKIRKMIQSAPEEVEKSGDSVLLRLRALYVPAKELSEIEVNMPKCFDGSIGYAIAIWTFSSTMKKDGKRGYPSSAPDFPHGRHVLAVYPSTTALYKATVVNPLRKVITLATHVLSENYELPVVSYIDNCDLKVTWIWNFWDVQMTGT